MSADQSKRLEQLRKAFESGALDEDTYQAAVAALGAPAPANAEVTGPGAVAQGFSPVSAGAGSVAVGGDVRGNVYVGSPPRDPAEALAIYRRVTVSACRHLPLRGIDPNASDAAGDQKRLDLAEVYVDLDTKTPVRLTKAEKKRRPERIELEDRKTRPLRALEATVRERHLVVMGDPGSGKSTFVNHMCLCLAAHGLDPKADWLSRLPDWPRKETDVVPISVILRDFARLLPEKTTKAEPRHLWDFIAGGLKAQNMEFASHPLRDALEAGKCIVFLDGLDEIPTTKQRAFVRDAVAAFAGRYSDSRLVVTCRTLSYQDPEWRLANVRSFELAPFAEEKIQRFIKAWYDELARVGTVKPEDATALAHRLEDAVRRPDLWRLAPNPLLLTVMALVHAHKGRLPDARALLYEDIVDILLWRWEEVKVWQGEDAPALRQFMSDAGRMDVDLKTVLWQLAFEAHQQAGTAGEDDLADIPEAKLQKALSGLHPDGSLDWARDVIEAMKLRAGLLLERAQGVYTFPHRTFQEYLAGAHLSSQAKFAELASELADAGALWREVTLLAVGRLVYLAGDKGKPLALVGELCPEESADQEAAWRKAWLAGDVLTEIGLNRVKDSELGKHLAGHVRERLAQLIETGRLNPVERVRAGNTLAQLRDPRFRPDAWYLPADPMLGFMEIPAGTFLMGSDKKSDPAARDEELPQHEVELPAYYIARYPVTVAQFRSFVEDSGHEPEDSDCLRGVANHPVVWVSWDEAMAYCEWLTDKLRVWESRSVGVREENEDIERFWQGLRDARLRVTLPSEAQWEKAARGIEGLIYPWGNRPDPLSANYADTGVGATSPVGCFSLGQTPYGCDDMSGNVWEWTRSLWGKEWDKPEFKYPCDPKDGREDTNASDQTPRVLRGGSFDGAPGSVRCAVRHGFYPYSRDYYLGVRVVSAPFFDSGL